MISGSSADPSKRETSVAETETRSRVGSLRSSRRTAWFPASHTYADAPLAAPPAAGGTTATPAGAANMDAGPSSSRCPLAATYDPAYENEATEATPSEPVTFPSSATRRTRFDPDSVTSSVRRP